mgnify:CR=1 FL=1
MNTAKFPRLASFQTSHIYTLPLKDGNGAFKELVVNFLEHVTGLIPDSSLLFKIENSWDKRY